MDLDELRTIANEELDRALARFWARVGELRDINEHFAAAIAAWLAGWTLSYLIPDTPPDPDQERRFLEQLERARRDLELQGEADGE
jgi:hypothetical protein